MTISISQSNYIPWKGYFDLIARSDVFVVYDDVQYTKNDWRNRNTIKTSTGTEWLTIPVRQSSLGQTVCETRVASMIWKKKHPKTLQANYAGAKSFHSVKEQVFSWYDIESDLLSEINLHFIKNICTYLGINTTLVDSRTLDLQGDRNERLVDACQKLGADTYLSGPSAQAYLDTDLFRQSDISVEWMDYAGYPPYEQRYPPFVHNVSVIDLIFAEGKNASNFLGHR
ncbi:MAG: WbqC family protein [Kiritimatiellae bacterium]|nr:WbqC family protein [Kiritimatiellia bacterium]